ncbi:antiviral reverse transcriptase Drt3a [Methylocaldum sp.]|uniref:antiviral reverse transcriptase Drt3a n=1 Tax=Methylocaldum sp. TaxID=1969727 RepID=UPI002D757C51|nr:antiviral reverse transcriptase Drt3a [Methylocaldum sp.]HYE37503.1 antiviral reverse transcriptase Drt3a [Methylocaldum sp.]
MHDHSFNRASISRALRKSDFRKNKSLYVEANKLAILDSAVISAQTAYSGSNPLTYFERGDKRIYRANHLTHELVLRQVNSNIKRLTRIRQPNRESIVEILTHLVSEGVPYRLYRLDIESFYESFSTDEVFKTVSSLPGISPSTRHLVGELLCHFKASGGTGIPRGLAVSATLADLMMQPFDYKLKMLTGVYFYERYVDDILIITNTKEHERVFLNNLKALLPSGLSFHNNNKKSINSLLSIVSPTKQAALTKPLFECSYLGYRISVYEPGKIKDLRPERHTRSVKVGIATSKLKKIKFRIIRSLLAFLNDGNFNLLVLRIKFLTSNFSVRDINRDKNKMAGIYYSYPQITSDSDNGLIELDDFLRRSVLNRHGRPFSKIATILTSAQKRKLLCHSFKRGHAERFFVYFHPSTIKDIQRCWEND